MPVSRLTNLSILTELTSAADTFTVGFVVRNAAPDSPKSLMIRAVGPSLVPLGVDGVVIDPRVEIFAGPNRTMANDNWEGDVSLVQAFAAVGAFALTAPTSFDAAAIVRTTSSDNSVKISGTGSGMLIAEVYDTTPGDEFTSLTPRVINMSVLKQVGEGLTVGIVVAGIEPKPLLIRAIGPTLGLAPFHVDDAVKNPRVSVFRGQTRVNENDNWNGTPQLAAAFDSVGAFALSAASLDAALIVTLLPGNYTMQVTGSDTLGGIALVEVYELP
jgi:hypothetical protein